MTNEEYRAFMCDPKNVMNCEGCPNNIGMNGDRPCGQQSCWIDTHCFIARQTFENAINDWLADHENLDLVLDGDPYNDEGAGAWVHQAHDDKSFYLLIMDEYGDISIEYDGAR